MAGAVALVVQQTRDTAMTINVTAEHIAKGEHGICSRCPIALAANEAAGVPSFVTHEVVCFRKATIPMPDEARQFIANFDNYRAVEPFSFELPLEATDLR